MKTLHQTLIVSAWCVAGLGLTSNSTHGEAVTFTVDPTQSSLTVSASLAAPGGAIQLQQQGPGSLTTTYEGTIEANVTASTIEFSGGSLIAARTNGTWEPGLGGAAGTAPANYAGLGNNSIASAKAAMRDILVDMFSGSLPISAGTFPAETLVFGFSSNAMSVLDYSYTTFLGPGSGSYDLTSYSTNSVGAIGSITTVGDELVLSIPANYTGHATLLSDNDLTYTLSGQLVARAAAATPLKIGSLDVSPGQVVFSLNVNIGPHYTILGSTNLTDWPTVVDEFTATENPTVRTSSIPILDQQFFQIRQD